MCNTHKQCQHKGPQGRNRYGSDEITKFVPMCTKLKNMTWPTYLPTWPKRKSMEYNMIKLKAKSFLKTLIKCLWQPTQYTRWTENMKYSKSIKVSNNIQNIIVQIRRYSVL